MSISSFVGKLRTFRTLCTPFLFDLIFKGPEAEQTVRTEVRAVRTGQCGEFIRCTALHWLKQLNNNGRCWQSGQCGF